MPVVENSRSLLTEVVEVRDPVSGRLTRPRFVDLRERQTNFSSTDRVIEGVDGQSWAQMSLANLLDARFWWLIADMSYVVDPFEELQPGERYRCPTLGRAEFELLPDAVGEVSFVPDR